MEAQDKLLATSTAIVKEQGYFMKKAIEQENMRDALKYGSNMICELRTSSLSPRFYYELYMQVFQELQNLVVFFGDKSRHGKKLSEIYESVQHAGNVLPRLYLLITVGVGYIQSKEISSAEILRDMAELCKGVQHPIRGLFLRYFLLQMTKDKLQSVADETSLDEVVDFLLLNFIEANRLWIRLSTTSAASVQSLGSSQFVRDRVKRERERYDLRLLVGSSLVRISQLEKITMEYYTTSILPRIVEQIIECKDPVAQQYLLDCTVQVFPDEFHLASLKLLLSTCAQTCKGVDLRPVLVNLMNRLGTYLSGPGGSTSHKWSSSSEIFTLFRTYLEKILHRTVDSKSGSDEVVGEGSTTAGSSESVSPALLPITNASHVDSPVEVAAKACGSMLELYKAFLLFTISLDKNRFDQISAIHGMALATLDKYMEVILSGGMGESCGDDSLEDLPSWLEPLIEIIETTLVNVPLETALALSQFGSLLSAIPKQFCRKVNIAMIDALIASGRYVSDPSTVTRFLTSIDSLLFGNSSSLEDTLKVCKVVHLFNALEGRIEGSDSLTEPFTHQYEILLILQSYFGRCQPQKAQLLFPALIFLSMDFIRRVDKVLAKEKAAASAPTVGHTDNPSNQDHSTSVSRNTGAATQHSLPSIKKVFQMIHSCCMVLGTNSGENTSETAFQLWVSGAKLANSLKFEAICLEFLTQALVLFEEEILNLPTTASKMNCVTTIIGVLLTFSSISKEHYDQLCTKITQQVATRFAKKSDQCTAILHCCNLFWSNEKFQDPKKVVECLQRCLKLADAIAATCIHGSSNNTSLFVDILNKYLYFYENGLDEYISPLNLSNLVALAGTVVSGQSETDIGAFYKQTTDYIWFRKRHPKNALFEQIVMPETI